MASTGAPHNRGRPGKEESQKTERKRINYPRTPIAIEKLGDACHGILRRLVTDIKQKTKKHIALTRNEIDLVWRVINLKPGQLKAKAFLKLDRKDPDEELQELDKEVEDEQITDSSPEEAEEIPEVTESVEELLEAAKDEEIEQQSGSQGEAVA